MKSTFIFVCFLVAITRVAEAHPQAPITAYVQESQTVCVAKVTAIEKGIITFSVEEVVKGNPPSVLKLAPVFEGFPLNSEWLLASTRASHNTNSVGWALKGDYGWVDAPVVRVDGKIHLAGYHSLGDPKLMADPSKGLTLEELRKLAVTPLPKN